MSRVVRVGPGFGDWLRSMREECSFTVRGLAQEARLSPGTISPIESRRYASPSLSVLDALSAALHVPVLAAGVVGGAFESDAVDVLRERAWDVAARLHPALAKDDWFARVGGRYVQAVREASRAEVDAAARRWSDAWSIPISAAQWSDLETKGELPANWSQALGRNLLDRLPGCWIWGILRAAGDSPEDGLYADLIMVTFLMGRLRRKRCEELSAGQDYETLAKAVPTLNPKDLARWGRSFRTQVAWTIPPSRFAKPSAAADRQAPLGNLTADEQALITRYRALSPTDRSAINHIVSGLLSSNEG